MSDVWAEVELGVRAVSYSYSSSDDAVSNPVNDHSNILATINGNRYDIGVDASMSSYIYGQPLSIPSGDGAAEYMYSQPTNGYYPYSTFTPFVSGSLVPSNYDVNNVNNVDLSYAGEALPNEIVGTTFLSDDFSRATVYVLTPESVKKTVVVPSGVSASSYVNSLNLDPFTAPLENKTVSPTGKEVIVSYPEYEWVDLGPAPGIDTSEIGPIAADAAAVAEQYNFVGVYLNPHKAGTFTEAMAQEFSDAKLSLVSIYETGKMGTLSYYTSNELQNGISAGKTAFKEAYSDGQPSGSAIYFGIEPGGDTYGNTALLDDIETYFQGVADGFAAEAKPLHTDTDYTIGVYGSPTTDSTMLADGVADLNWVAGSHSFSGYETYAGWNLKQTSIDKPAFGTTVDFDVTQGTNFGQWSLPSVA